MSRFKSISVKSLTLFNIGNTSKNEEPIEERLKPEQFSFIKTVRHGFPYKPTCIAYDPLQKILAIGTAKGYINFYGQPGVQCTVSHDKKVIVKKLLFLVNEGALVSVCSDDAIHLWNLRHRKPAIVHSLHFNYKRDSISCASVSFQSKWIYLGTKSGNVHVLNIETFQLSGYIIHWNKAIVRSKKEHPGPIYEILENPQDANKILICFESGLVVLWDLKNRIVDERFYSPQNSLQSASWYCDGKQFVTSHHDGSLSVWNIKNPQRPMEVFNPHSQGKSKSGETFKSICNPIYKVCFVRESCFLFSGGLNHGNKYQGLTVMEGKTKKLLDTKPIVDFAIMNSTPWVSEEVVTTGLIVLLQTELIVYDLSNPKFSHLSVYDIPYEFSLHESPVTFTDYIGHCPPSLLEDLYSTGSKSRKPFSENWPINGGTLGDDYENSSVDLIITGHADGTVKFWDGSSGSFALIAVLPTYRYFHKRRRVSKTDNNGSKESNSDELHDEDFEFLAIQMAYVCVFSRTLALVNAGNNVLYFIFDNNEKSFELVILPIEIVPEKSEETNDISSQAETIQEVSPESRENDFDCELETTTDSAQQNEDEKSDADKLSPSVTTLPAQSIWRPKTGFGKRPPGFQGKLCCVIDMTENTLPLCYLTLSSGFGIMAFGSLNYLVLVDTIQNKLISTFYPPDLTVAKVPSTPCTPATPLTPGYLSGDGESPSSKKRDFRCPSRRRAMKSKHKPLEASTENDFSDGAVLSVTTSENSSEHILCVTCAYTFTKKKENLVGPCFWVGTSTGNVILFAASFPPAGEQRQTQPVLTFNTGLVFTHKGEVDNISILDKNGHLFSSPSCFWSSAGIPDDSRTAVCSNDNNEERHFLVVCTDKEAEVHCLPSHARFSKKDLSEYNSVLTSDVVTIEGNSCLVCLCESGNFLAFSLPSLALLMNLIWEFPSQRTNFLRTFKLACDGQALYLHSPTELQFVSIVTKTGLNFPEFSGSLFTVVPVPERPRRGFLASLFNIGPSDLDRERLFGVESGKSSQYLATRIPGKGTEDIQDKSGGVADVMAKNMQAVKERGEKLEDLDLKTQHMRDQANQYSRNARALAHKFKEKKWYQW